MKELRTALGPGARRCRHAGRRGVLLLAAVALTSAACGTRLSHDEIVEAARGTTSAGEAAANVGARSSGPLLGGAETADAPGASTDGLGTNEGESGAAGSGTTGTGRGATADQRTGVVARAGGGAAKSPLKIATVGTLSGPAGAVLKPSVDALQAWVKYVNEKGGVAGHPVELIVADDGGDTAKHRSLVQQVVERDRVIALVQNNEALTGAGTVDYINAKRVPVIGTDTAGDWANESPMYFPQASSGRHLIAVAAAGPARQAANRGVKVGGILACSEAQVCTDLYNNGEAIMAEYGIRTTYKGRASLAQPDFTAECLAAQNEGVELLLISLPAPAVARVASSCARQGYRPFFGFGQAIIVDSQKNDPNLNGRVLGDTNVFPYFRNDTPATAEFQEVAKQFGLTPGAGIATGWVSAKLFERAAANISEPPTSESLLAGLWSIRDDDLGGLTLPLTFIENQPAKQRACWYDVVIENNQWKSPDNYTLQCR